MLLSLVACGKSEAAKAVDDQIAAIGTVTLESEGLIAAAEQAAADLSEEDRKQLDNVEALAKARETYEALVLEAKAAEVREKAAKVEDAIAAIGTVTPDSGDAIAAARAALENSEAEVQAEVTNLAVLEAAETEIENLRVKSVEDLIAAIGEVTESSGDLIQAAQSGFDSLSAENAAKVGNSQVLTDAVGAFQAIRQSQAQALLNEFRVEDDPVRGMKFYYSKAQLYYADDRSYVFPYIGMNNDNEVWLCAEFHYTGDDWIFFKKITFAVDGKNTVKTFSYYNDIVRDHAYGDVWEFVNTGEGNQYEDLFRSIAGSSTTIVRFEGDNYWYDLTVSQGDKDAIRKVLTTFDALRDAGYKQI